MTSPKSPASCLYLAELALANGWPVDEVRHTFEVIVGPNEPPAGVQEGGIATAKPAVTPATSEAISFTSSKTGAGSRVLREHFQRAASRKT